MGRLRSRNRYEVIILPSKGGYRFPYKDDALTFAIEKDSKGANVKIKNLRTDQITHLLPKGRCDCTVCGNELEGKKHCPLCNALHHYL